MAIYLDHAAATPLRGEVLERMMPYLTGLQGNPSSPHSAGRAARRALDEARESIAASLRADPREVVFTSGGTESINLSLKGAAWAGKATGNRIVTTAVEHRAVLDTCASLEKFGFEVVRVPVDRYGAGGPRRPRGGGHGAHLPRVAPARQQRGGHRRRPRVTGPARAVGRSGAHPCRRGPGGSIDGPRHPVDGHRPAIGRQPQAGRPDWHGRRVAASRHGHPAPGAWRQPGASSACGHGERGRCRGHGGGLGAHRSRTRRPPWPRCTSAAIDWPQGPCSPSRAWS